MAQFQIISDVHKDIRSTPFKISAVCDNLIIAGDLSTYVDPKYKDYLAELTSEFRNVYYVAGNHEFYTGERRGRDSILEYIDRVCASMNNNCNHLRAHTSPVKLPGHDVEVLGCTLWTNGATESNSSLINDFRSIMNDMGDIMTVDDFNDWHHDDKEHIRRSVRSVNSRGNRAVVVTHHCPDFRLSLFNESRVRHGFGDLYFCTDMADIMSYPSICGWAYGHTHESGVFKLPGLRYKVITNAVGYEGESTGYAPGSGMIV